MTANETNILEAAAAKFTAERNVPNFFELLQILSESFVWVPCYAVMSDNDRAAIEKMIADAGDDLNSLVGKVFSNRDATRLVPDILQGGDDYFFPIFSSPEAMGEYGETISKVEKHMLEVIALARNNERDLKGIILNAFTDSVVLDKEIWNIMENMEDILSQSSEG